jgi:serine/threonine-protein kinase
MSETASELRRPELPPAAGDAGPVRADGSSLSASGALRPLADEPTIITGRPPLPAPAMSDSTCRILEGRVMPGDRLGQFELVEYVGGGGMGRVFRATDTHLSRTVALKILPPDQAADPDALQRFQNEAQSAARLDHDNIARAFYVGEDRGLHYIVFEFVEGVNVRVLVEQKGPLPLAEAISYTLQIAEALAHADARAVVHRDIKPSNVLITPEGRVKLIDMGLARLRQTDPAVADLTASGVTLGTFDYISPEQARDPRNADIRSDIYSLGCTFFFMLAGQPPFPEGTVLQKLLQHQGDEPPDIIEFRPELPEESSRVLRKMMAKDPARRYPGPADLVADLLLLAEEIGLRPMSPTSRIWLAPQDEPLSFLQRHLPWLAPVAALVCIVVLLHFIWSSSTPRDDQLPLPSADVALFSPKEPATPPGAEKTTELAKPGRMPAEANGVGKGGDQPEREIAGHVTAKASASAASRGSPPAGGATPPPLAKVAPAAGVPLPTVVAPPSKPASDSAATPKSAPKRSGLLIVSEKPEGDDQFLSLAAACAVARNGDVIELRFNGPREDRPMKIANLHVTIQAGEGYHPIVVFHPTDADPVKYARSMFTLTASQFTLAGVAMELHVPRDVPADNWSLFETCGGEMVRLEHCSLTVRNTSDQGLTYQQDVAFFRARSAPEAEGAVGNTPAATPLATLLLTDCIARGEADFLRVDDLQPVHLTWDNGLLVTSERLLVAGGGQAAPKLDEMLRIELLHMTAAVRGGLCRLTSNTSNPYQLTAQFVSTNSILIASPGVPLIEQEGAASVDNLRQRFIWSGDRNCYQDVDVFWAVRNLDPETQPDVMTYELWKAYWGPSRENQPSIERLLWKKADDADRPLHAQGPADYTLEDPTGGDSATGAPGCQIDRLPLLPPEPASPKSGRPGSPHGAGTLRRPSHG